jgi:hypothetical protein
MLVMVVVVNLTLIIVNNYPFCGTHVVFMEHCCAIISFMFEFIKIIKSLDIVNIVATHAP